MFFPAMYLRWQWSVPANLLLAGEYAVTEENGLGIAIAVEPRASCSVYCTVEHEPSPDGRALLDAVIGLDAFSAGGSSEGSDGEVRSRLEVIARTAQSEDKSWPETANPVVRSTIEVVRSHVAVHLSADDSPQTSVDEACMWHIVIDTSAFFDTRTGRKLGLGSSAAATVLLAAAVMRIGGIDPVLQRNTLVALAIAAHRRAHGGRGSGYDVVASAAGGVVRFCGGLTPSWEHSGLQSQIERQRISLYGWSAGKPVHSAEAVERFQRYCPEGCAERERFIGENNRLIGRLEEAHDWPSLFRPIAIARRLGETIGEAIGVPATLPMSCAHVDDGWTVKASGAGNERAIILSLKEPRRPLPVDVEAMVPATDGLRWEYGAPSSTEGGGNGSASTGAHRKRSGGRTDSGPVTRRGMVVGLAADPPPSPGDADRAAGPP